MLKWIKLQLSSFVYYQSLSYIFLVNQKSLIFHTKTQRGQKKVRKIIKIGQKMARKKQKTGQNKINKNLKIRSEFPNFPMGSLNK